MLLRLTCVSALLCVSATEFSLNASADDPPVRIETAPLRPFQATASDWVDANQSTVRQLNRSIWEFAELGLQERKSSTLLATTLEEAGFEVRSNVAGMPTAFVASYGTGKPIIGLLAEFDALPGMSQKISGTREAITDGTPGHACGHSGLGSGAVAAAIAVRTAMEQHDLPGTIRLYGTPAEETVIGKVYMLLAGEFRDLDVCLHWHPSTQTGAWAGSSKALISAKFTFHGTAAHASGNPENGRSALDAVELMNSGVNFAREHIREDARFHYVITDGGGAPNVVPSTATVWYFVRANSHEDVDTNFAWLQEIARGAALMTRTTMSFKVDTDCHELVPNMPLSERLYDNLLRVDRPKFTQEEQAFARRLQQSLVDESGVDLELAINDRVETVAESSAPSKGSTDVGDISWFVPVGGIRTTCFAAGSPGHSWQNVACIASSIGEKGILYAAKVLAVTAIELLESPELVTEARGDWTRRMEHRVYKSLIPDGQLPPTDIRD